MNAKIAKGKLPLQIRTDLKMQMRDIMTLNPVTATEMMTVAEAMILLHKNHIHHLPVVRPLAGGGQEVVGVVTDRNLMSAKSIFVGTRMEDPKDTLTLAIRLKGIMAKPVFTLPPEGSVKEAVKLMRDRTIGCVPIVEDHALVGIVTGRDMLDVLWERL